MECFYKTLKVERIHHVEYRTRDEARLDIAWCTWKRGRVTRLVSKQWQCWL